MKYRLLMLSPVFEAPPEVVREDVAQAYRVIEYESPEELAALLQEAVTLLAQEVTEDATPAPAPPPPPGGVEAP